MFETIQQNKEKQAQKEQAEKMKKLDEMAENVLILLKSKDITIMETSAVLQIASDALKRKVGEMKLD